MIAQVLSPDLITFDHIKEARNGDNSVIEFILSCLHSTICALIRAMHVAFPDIEDAVQDSFIVVLKCIQLYKRRYGRFKDYVFISVKNSLIDRFNRSNRRKTIPLDAIPTPSFEANEIISEARDILNRLPKNQKKILKQYHGIGGGPEYSPRQIAAINNMSEASVKREIMEAYAFIREGNQV